MNLICVNLEEAWSFESYSYKRFIKRIREAGLEEVNIECSAFIGNQFILGNRGNTANPKNLLILTDNNFWVRQGEARVSFLELELVLTSETFIGISELCYVESMDVLLFSLSTEVTSNSFDDGTIGDSYIGWINSVSQKINEPKLKLDGMLNLTGVAPDFKGEKIEGLCIASSSPDELIIHLISDNDQGESKLFKVRIS